MAGRVSATKYAGSSLLICQRNYSEYGSSYMTPTYGAPYPYEEPFPYKTKKFTMLTEHFDYTLPRFNENTKVIVVEGNLAVGKHKFAEELAKNFDLKLFPATDESRCFRLETNNFDLRNFNQFLPKRSQWYDLEDFLTDPNPQKGRIGFLQLSWLVHKFQTYCQALTHLFNTGQGVVIVKSPFSNHVFTDALYKCGYLTPNFNKYYDDFDRNSVCELLKPHLTIYLDAPVNVIRDKITARGNPLEVESKNLTDEYLQAIEDFYKKKHLPSMAKSGVVMEVDSTEIIDDIDLDAIAEEVQNINMQTEDSEDTKFRDWFDMSEDYASYYRRRFASDILERDCFSRDRPIECPEIMWHDDDLPILNNHIRQHPAVMYEPGWAKELGHNPTWRF